MKGEAQLHVLLLKIFNKDLIRRRKTFYFLSVFVLEIKYKHYDVIILDLIFV